MARKTVSVRLESVFFPPNYTDSLYICIETITSCSIHDIRQLTRQLNLLLFFGGGGGGEGDLENIKTNYPVGTKKLTRVIDRKQRYFPGWPGP